MQGSRLLVAAVVASMWAVAVSGDTRWTHRGNTASRNGVGAGSAPAIATARFVVNGGRTLVGQSAPVVAGNRIFVYAKDLAKTGNEVLAFSEIDGSLLWWRSVGAAQWDSRSSPTVDTARGLVLIGSGTKVTAMSMETGAVAWETTLGNRPVVNASVCVWGGLAMVSDYCPYAAGGKLYAIRLEPAELAGQVAWSHSLSKCIGSEAAMDAAGAGHVWVTDYAGYLRQVTLSGVAGWTFALPGAGESKPPYGGFAGGPAVEGGRVYAATYNTDESSGENSGRLVCVDAATGQEVWSAASERTHSVPVVTGGLVVLSGGIDGFGSRAKVQAFDKATGSLRWEWDGCGGWTQQPLAVGNVLYVGDIPAGGGLSDPCTDLYAIDLTKTPSEQGFVIARYTGAGSSPAYANGNIYTIGAAGLHAFGPPPALEVEVSALHGWVYQNTASTTLDRHRDTLTASVRNDPFGNATYTMTVAKAGGSGEVTVADTDNPLVKQVVGGRRADGAAGTGDCQLRVTVTGNEHGGSHEALVTVRVRRLGDANGDSWVTTDDAVQLTKRLNNLGVGSLTARDFDLTGDGWVTADDDVLLTKMLNGLAVP